jgi:hypothetical protein
VQKIIEEMDKMTKEIQFDLTKIFERDHIGFLSTIHKDSGAIQQNVVSWIHPFKANVLRIAVAAKSQIVTNIEENDHINFSFFYEKSIVSSQSKAKIITKKIPEVPFPLALIEFAVNELHDIMFYGAEIAHEPIHLKTYNNEAAKKLDIQVYQGMALNYEKSDFLQQT